MEHPDPSSPARRYNTRLGLVLFGVYLVLYTGFVVLSAFAPSVMERVVLAGLNLAVVYGFALIVVAFVLAVVYGLLCRDDSESGAAR